MDFKITDCLISKNFLNCNHLVIKNIERQIKLTRDVEHELRRKYNLYGL